MFCCFCIYAVLLYLLLLLITKVCCVGVWRTNLKCIAMRNTSQQKIITNSSFDQTNVESGRLK